MGNSVSNFCNKTMDKFKAFNNFNWMITPEIITFAFGLCFLGVVLWIAFGDQYSNLSMSVRCISGAISLVAVRVVVEFTMVIFKNNEYLRRLVELQERDTKQ